VVVNVRSCFTAVLGTGLYFKRLPGAMLVLFYTILAKILDMGTGFTSFIKFMLYLMLLLTLQELGELHQMTEQSVASNEMKLDKSKLKLKTVSELV
jgi:hypothetical protein